MNDRDLRPSPTESVNGERARHAKAPFQCACKGVPAPGSCFTRIPARARTYFHSPNIVCSRVFSLGASPLPHCRTCCATAFSSSAASCDTVPALALDGLPPMWSSRMPPLSGTSTASTAATHFTLALTLEDDVNDTSPPSELTVALNAKKNDTFPENVLTRRDCNLVVQPRGLLHPPQLLPSPACRPRSDCMLWSPAVTLSLRMCSDIRSVNRSMSRSSRTAKEWPVQFWRVRYFYLVC
jgi:hypothetical protein